MIKFQTPELLILSLLVIYGGYKAVQMTGLKRHVGLLNVAVALLLLLAVSGPEITVSQEDELRPSVTVIQDVSESSSLINDWESESDFANLNVRNVDSDSDSFEAQVESIVEEDERYLFVSDLQFESDLPQYFVENNVSMNLLTPEIDEEHAVRIEGPRQTVIGAENRFNIEVSSSTSESVNVEAGIGNETLESGEPPLELDLSFDEEGYQEIWAEIETEDRFSENNNYYKTVKVMEKPMIASIGQSSGLEDELESFYSIDSFENLPSNLEEYEAVIMKQEEDSKQLRDFLVDGGGLMYTGNEYEMDYLPVEPAERPEETDAPLVVLLMDISQNMACSSDSPCGDQLGGGVEAENMATSMIVANQIVEGLPDNARVSLLPYAERAYVGDMNEPRVIASNRQSITEDISSLQPLNEISRHERGLREADNILSRNEGDGNVVMISNGRIAERLNRDTTIDDSNLEVRTLGGRLTTIGVTSELDSLRDEDEEFLQDLAESSENGFYMDGRNPNLEFTFDAGGGADEMQPLVVSNSNHFITDGYRPNASVFEVDGVEPRPAADELVSTANGEPVLVSGRYGLGRITAFSADNSDLESLMDQDPSLVGRTLSWSSGPLERDIWVEGSRVGDDFQVVSREPLEGFSRESDERYINSIEPDETGFYSEYNTSYSVNYRSEIERVGYNEEEFSRFTNNGNIYSEENLDVFFEGLDEEPVESQESMELTSYLVALAMIIYLFFVGIRKRNGLA